MRAPVLVAALAVLAAALRVELARDNLWGDELFLLEIVRGHGLGEALGIVRETESTPPLYFVLAWLAAQLGPDEDLVRVPALLAGVALVPLTYVLGERTVGRVPGVIAAALLAVTPYDLFYGSEARGYSTVALLSVASALALVELARTGRRRWAVVLAVAMAGAMLTHYLAVFALLAQLAWVAWAHREHLAPVGAACAGAALLYAPWLPGTLDQVEDNTSERVTGLSLSGPDIAEGIARIWFGHPFAPLDELPGVAGLLLIAVGLALAAAGALRHRTRPRDTTVLLVAIAAATPAAALLYELGPNSVLLPRYLIASVPAAALVLGLLLTRPRRPGLVAGATALVLAGVLLGTARTLGEDGRRPDYRAIARELDRSARPDEPVLELGIFSGPPGRQLGYHFERPHPRYVPSGEDPAPALAAGRRAGRLHLVVPAGGVATFTRLTGVEEAGFRLVRRRDEPGIFALALLTYEPAGG